MTVPTNTAEERTAIDWWTGGGQIDETLAMMTAIRGADSPVAAATFTVKQRWNGRQPHGPSNRCLRGVCASLFQRDSVP